MHTASPLLPTGGSLPHAAAAAPAAARKPFQRAPGSVPATTTGTVRFYGGTSDGQPPNVDFKTGESNILPAITASATITDLRTFEPPTTLAAEGVAWAHAPTALTEADLTAPDNHAWVQAHFWPECADLVKRLSGATVALPYQYRHRRMEPDTVLTDARGTSGKPVLNFHCDNDAVTAEVNLRRRVGDARAARWLGKHWGIVNVWRPIGDTVRQFPLAVLDSHAFDRATNSAAVHTKNNYKAHTTVMSYRADYDYYYVSDMTPDEALLFVDYDSRPHGQMVGVAHGAFDDHRRVPDPPLRRSVEVRVLVLFDDEDEAPEEDEAAAAAAPTEAEEKK